MLIQTVRAPELLDSARILAKSSNLWVFVLNNVRRQTTDGRLMS